MLDKILPCSLCSPSHQEHLLRRGHQVCRSRGQEAAREPGVQPADAEAQGESRKTDQRRAEQTEERRGVVGERRQAEGGAVLLRVTGARLINPRHRFFLAPRCSGDWRCVKLRQGRFKLSCASGDEELFAEPAAGASARAGWGGESPRVRPRPTNNRHTDFKVWCGIGVCTVAPEEVSP